MVLDLNDYDFSDYSILFAENDRILQKINKYYDVNLYFKDGILYTDNHEKNVLIKKALENIIKTAHENGEVNDNDLSAILSNNFYKEFICNGLAGKKYYLRTYGQKKLYESFQKKVVTFVCGPAGTGKTFLAVVFAYNMLKKAEIKKIIITRPVVESGESLGFLPGDLQEKVDPYLRPIYDSFESLVGMETTTKMIEKGIIEIAPLAYMRGRTLNDACVILDEAQNTTEMQIKMFLTRLGFNSKMIITGDITQIDLPPHKKSGLIQAMKVVKNIEEVGIIEMGSKDVVRHPVVQKIIDAYKKQ
ncbi:MAG: PhoH family protein [Erysipelotrichia bacterium]|nr:PhoH family protein [Erysipelotrichia bacterium]